MIFAITILTAVTVFLCWCLIKLTVHALLLFAAVTTALLLAHAGLKFGTVLVCGGAVAFAVLACGRLIVAQAIPPTLRLGILTAFAAPAAVAAYHSVLGLTAPVVAGSDAVRTMAAVTIALMVGGAAWRNVAGKGMPRSQP